MTHLEPDDTKVHESTAGMIARVVREAIAAGDLAPGQQLGEVELARTLGVSRGPLREGLQRLAQEGLVDAFPHRGLFVVEMTAERAKDTYLARQAVERAAAELIHAEGHADETGTGLLSVVDRMAQAASRGDSDAVTEADLCFHELLVQRCGSPRLQWMHRTVLTETRMCLNALSPTYADADERPAEHRAIAQSFLDRQPGVTDRLIVAHMNDGYRRLFPSG